LGRLLGGTIESYRTEEAKLLKIKKHETKVFLVLSIS